MNTNQKGYFQADNDIFDNFTLGLSLHEKIVYLYLSRCCNQGATAFPSYQTIAKRCGMAKKSAVNAVRTLEKRRFLQVERSDESSIKHNPNRYKAKPLPSMKKPGP